MTKEAKEQYVKELRVKRAEQKANKLISIELGQRQGEQWCKIKLKGQVRPEEEWLCPKDTKKSPKCLERGIRLSALHFLEDQAICSGNMEYCGTGVNGGRLLSQFCEK